MEELGSYDPHANPPKVQLNRERVNEWVAKGAMMSPTVKKLVARTA